MDNKYEYLKKIFDNSRYTVAMCGSGTLLEAGHETFRHQAYAYEIERKYGRSPEYIFASNYYNTRTDKFFEFYKSEVLKKIIEPTETSYALQRMEEKGRLQCIMTSNFYDIERRAGCKNVINLHGTIYHNVCPRCKKEYPMEYIRDCKKVPYCEQCSSVVRPDVALYGEQLDSRLTSHAASEVEKADTLLLLGTTLASDVYSNYVRYFEGSHVVIIHEKEHFTDSKADLVIYDAPKNVLPKLGY